MPLILLSDYTPLWNDPLSVKWPLVSRYNVCRALKSPNQSSSIFNPIWNEKLGIRLNKHMPQKRHENRYTHLPACSPLKNDPKTAPKSQARHHPSRWGHRAIPQFDAWDLPFKNCLVWSHVWFYPLLPHISRCFQPTLSPTNQILTIFSQNSRCIFPKGRYFPLHSRHYGMANQRRRWAAHDAQVQRVESGTSSTKKQLFPDRLPLNHR